MKTEELPKLDVTKYVGTDTEVVSAAILTTRYGRCLKVQTAEILLKGGDTLPDDKKLSASMLLGFHENAVGETIVARDGKLDTWLKGHKLSGKDIPDGIQDGEQIQKLLGMKVKVQKNSKGFLEIV